MLKGKFAALFAGAGLMLLAHAAQATSYNVTLQPGPGSSGTYSATVTQTGSVWAVTSVNANGGAPNANGDVVRLYFYDGSNNFVAGSGGFTNGGVDGPPGTNWGPWYNVTNGAQMYSQWDTIANTGNELLDTGGNTFNGGNITATGAVNAQIEVLSTAGYTWTSPLIVPPVIPEGSSLAMLLPGLVPLGMVLRRRRASRK